MEAHDGPSVYTVVELIGTSDKSWEDAAKAAVESGAAKSLRDLRVAEVVQQDIVIENGKVEAYRTKLTGFLQVRGWAKAAAGLSGPRRLASPLALKRSRPFFAVFLTAARAKVLARRQSHDPHLDHVRRHRGWREL